jgi:solute carrier family 5 (sodium-coupled monocarboxylate transporter), member 8/12
VLNSTAGVLYKDIVKGCFKCELSEKAASLFIKGSVLVLGCLAMAFLFIIEKLGGILAAGSALAAIGNGTTFGVFTLGMLIPWATSKGALAGAIAGALMSGWVSLGSQAAIAAGIITPHKLNVSIEDCPGNYTVDRYYPDESDVFPLYRLSYNWINPIGVTTVLVVGTIVSFLTGPRNLKKIDPELISPVIHKFLPTESFENYGTASIVQKKEIKE